jgi:hypothetical protein
VLGDLKISTASNPFNKDSNHQFRGSFTPSNESVIGYMIEFNLNNATVAELDPVVLQIAGQNYSFGTHHSLNGTKVISYSTGFVIDPCAYPQTTKGNAIQASFNATTDASSGMLTLTMWSDSDTLRVTDGGIYKLGCFFTSCETFLYIEPKTDLDEFSVEITLHPYANLDTKLVVAGGPNSCPTVWNKGALHMEKNLPAGQDSVIRIEKGFKKIWLLFTSEESSSQVMISYKVSNMTAVQPAAVQPTAVQPSHQSAPTNSPQKESLEFGGQSIWFWVGIGSAGVIIIVAIIVFVVRKKRTTGYIQV